MVECNLPKVDVEGSSPFVRYFVARKMCKGREPSTRQSLVKVRAQAERRLEQFCLKEMKISEKQNAELPFNARRSKRVPSSAILLQKRCVRDENPQQFLYKTCSENCESDIFTPPISPQINLKV